LCKKTTDTSGVPYLLTTLVSTKGASSLQASSERKNAEVPPHASLKKLNRGQFSHNID